MARGRIAQPGSKTVTLSAKVPPDLAAAVERTRGETSRSDWIADAIASKLAGASPAPRRRKSPAPQQAATPAPPPPQVIEDAIVPMERSCPHPKARVIKGFCGACGRPANG